MGKVGRPATSVEDLLELRDQLEYVFTHGMDAMNNRLNNGQYEDGFEPISIAGPIQLRKAGQGHPTTLEYELSHKHCKFRISVSRMNRPRYKIGDPPPSNE